MPGTATDYNIASTDIASATLQTTTLDLPVDGTLQSCDVGIVGVSQGPCWALIAYGDSLSLSFTQLTAGFIRSSSAVGFNERLAWQGSLNLGARQAAHPQLRVTIRNDSGAAVTGIAITWEVSHG
jgi:hypothetical protein